MIGDVPLTGEPFYSLSAGEVVYAGGDENNTIAVYDENADITTLYLHASTIRVKEGQTVQVGKEYPLGIQGNTGISDDPQESEHVHIEVRNGKQTKPACGANESIDPFDYLYRQLQSSKN